jgi:hypothetical protein
MTRRLSALGVAAAFALASCGRPDASGVYVVKSDREATLLQLIQGKDGAISGRIESMSIGQGGGVNDQSAPLDGNASGHDLVLKPTSLWFGGVSASGSFTRTLLTLSRNGAEVKARKASLDEFQKAVAQLKARATKERHQIAETQADQAAAAASAVSFTDGAGSPAKLQEAAADLGASAIKLNDAVTAAPDFTRQSVANTAQIAGMAQSASTLSRTEKGRLAASANQLLARTNQIDVARTQYAIGLNRIVQRAAPIATAVERFCETPQANPFGRPCTQAKTAATDFESALVRASTVFKGHKQAVQTELSKQSDIIRKMGG